MNHIILTVLPLLFKIWQYLCTYKYIHIHMCNMHTTTCQWKHADLCEHILSRRTEVELKWKNILFLQKTKSLKVPVALGSDPQARLVCTVPSPWTVGISLWAIWLLPFFSGSQSSQQDPATQLHSETLEDESFLMHLPPLWPAWVSLVPSTLLEWQRVWRQLPPFFFVV